MSRDAETNGMCRTCLGASYNVHYSYLERDYEHAALTEEVYGNNSLNIPVD